MEHKERMLIFDHLNIVYALISEKRDAIVEQDVESINLRLGMLEAQTVLIDYMKKIINEVE